MPIETLMGFIQPIWGYHNTDIQDIIDELDTNITGYQEFKTTTDPSSALTQAYYFKLTLNGTVFNTGVDISVNLTASASLATIATAIATAINSIVASSVTSEVDPLTGKIRVYSTNTTQLISSVSFLAPTTGSSLLSLLGGVEESVKKPQLLKGFEVNPTKTLPAIVTNLTILDSRVATVNFSAEIQTQNFNCRIFGSSEYITQRLTEDAKYIINKKTLSGGWWRVDSVYPDLNDMSRHVYNLYGKQVLFVNNLGKI